MAAVSDVSLLDEISTAYGTHAAVDMEHAFFQYLSGRRGRNSSYVLGLDKSTHGCSCPRPVINSPALSHNIVQRDLDCVDIQQNIIHYINDILVNNTLTAPYPFVFPSHLSGAKP